MFNIDEIEKKLLEDCKKQNVNRIVVGAVILNKNKDSILLLKRHGNDFMPFLEELPSGKVEKGESLKKALIREIKEEINLETKEINKFVNYFDYHSSSGKLTRQFNFLVTLKEESPIKLNPEEHISYRWIKIKNSDENITTAIKDILKVLN